jgi:hypothetical protein
METTTQLTAYVMLTLLMLQGVAFFVAVSYWLSLKQGGDKSTGYKSSLWSGVGFLVMFVNGLLASANVAQPLMTILASFSMGCIGCLLLYWSRYQRKNLKHLK